MSSNIKNITNSDITIPKLKNSVKSINNINPPINYVSSYTKVKEDMSELDTRIKENREKFQESVRQSLKTGKLTIGTFTPKIKKEVGKINITNQLIQLLIPHKSKLVEQQYFEKINVTPNCVFDNIDLSVKEKARILEYCRIRPKKNTQLSGIVYIPVNYTQLSKLYSKTKILDTLRQKIIEYNPELISKIKIPNELNDLHHGRIFPIGHLGYCSISRKSRPTIFYNYVEIDIVNCHPTIIFEVIKLLNLNLPMITQYINRRDEHLEILSKYYGKDKNTIKQLLLILMYINRTLKWRENNNITLPDPKFIIEFGNEMEYFRSIIINFIQEYSYERKINTNRITSFNYVFAYFLQNIEIRILEVMYEYCKSQGLIQVVESNGLKGEVITFCHDGLLLPEENIDKNEYNRLRLVNGMSDLVYQKLGLRVQFKIKEPKLKELK